MKIYIYLAIGILAFFVSCGNKSKLRLDLSATVVYVGEHEEILLDCTNMYGEFGNRETKKNEIVEIKSVRDDGRIVVNWGPDFDSKQKADLNVGPSIPSDGPKVVVEIILTDSKATFSIKQQK